METKEIKGSKVKGTNKRGNKRLKASKAKKALTGYDAFAPSDSPGRIKARAELSKEKGHAVVGNLRVRKWTRDEATLLLYEACHLTFTTDRFTTIKGLFFHLGTSLNTAVRLCKRYPELKEVYEGIKSNIGHHCFEAINAGKMPVSLGLFNLTWNHGYREDKTEVPEATQNIEITLPPEIEESLMKEANKCTAPPEDTEG